MLDRTTIAAVSTPPGISGIAVVRASGPRALSILNGIFAPTKDKALTETPRTLRHGWVVDESGIRVDQVLAVFFPAPNSYTGEDLVEVHGHGGRVAVERILTLMYEHGAEPAGPGEFTRRAFTSGRIDLIQAESVIGVIEAASVAGLRVAQSALAGGLSNKITELRDALAEVCALLEAHIDFPEDDLGAFPADRAVGRIEPIAEECQRLADSYAQGTLLQNGVKTVLAGRPNVGKSSILNRLLEREKAIVTPVPGTTRDAVEDVLTIEGVAFRLTDVAGYRASDDPVESAGLRIAAQKAAAADLVLFVADLSEAPHPDDHALWDLIGEKKPPRGVLPVLNKSDLSGNDNVTIWKDKINEWSGAGPVVASALTGDGFDELRTRMRTAALSDDLPSAGDMIVTRLRHKTALEKAAAAVEEAARGIGDGVPLDLVAVPLREGLDHLGSIVGIVTTDDLLDRIFSEFCIGK